MMFDETELSLQRLGMGKWRLWCLLTGIHYSSLFIILICWSICWFHTLFSEAYTIFHCFLPNEILFNSLWESVGIQPLKTWLVSQTFEGNGRLWTSGNQTCWKGPANAIYTIVILIYCYFGEFFWFLDLQHMGFLWVFCGVYHCTHPSFSNSVVSGLNRITANSSVTSRWAFSKGGARARELSGILKIFGYHHLDQSDFTWLHSNGHDMSWFHQRDGYSNP